MSSIETVKHRLNSSLNVDLSLKMYDAFIARNVNTAFQCESMAHILPPLELLGLWNTCVNNIRVLKLHTTIINRINGYVRFISSSTLYLQGYLSLSNFLQ